MRVSEYIPRYYFLGAEELIYKVRILVQDRRDKPFAGIPVRIHADNRIHETKTNGNGVAIVDVAIPSGTNTITASALLPEGPSVQVIPVPEIPRRVVTFRSVEQAPRVLLTVPEIIAGTGGMLSAAIGFIWNIEWLKVLGESLFVVSLFSAFTRE